LKDTLTLIWRKTLTHLDMSLKSFTKSEININYTSMRGLGKHPCDPHDLIHDAYRIEGIGPEECRAIFFDWAMGLTAGLDIVAAAKTLHADLAGKNPGHPMSGLLAEASLGMAQRPGRSGRRNGGRRRQPS
jgi:hypothetical protein